MTSAKIKKFRIIKYKNIVKPALKIKNVSKSFDGIPVLNNLNLSIFPGSINGLLGENGSGKTTLFNLILGILKADSGEIYAKGSALISSMAIHERCQKFRISYVPQKESLFSGLSCEDNIKGLCQLQKMDSRKIEEVCDQLLTEFSLLDVKKTKAKNLSGGEKKKLSIARALINEPELILADEPTGSLDRKTANEIFSLFLKLKSKNRSILYATHNRELSNRADYKLNILDGNIIKQK